MAGLKAPVPHFICHCSTTKDRWHRAAVMLSLNVNHLTVYGKSLAEMQASLVTRYGTLQPLRSPARHRFKMSPRSTALC
jgi:hypothetical protein